MPKHNYPPFCPNCVKWMKCVHERVVVWDDRSFVRGKLFECEKCGGKVITFPEDAQWNFVGGNDKFVQKTKSDHRIMNINSK